LFDTKEEDIKNLIDKKVRPTQDFLNTQKKNNVLFNAHKNLIFEDAYKNNGLILSRGSP
jgi:hypothetical protein